MCRTCGVGVKATGVVGVVALTGTKPELDGKVVSSSTSSLSPGFSALHDTWAGGFPAILEVGVSYEELNVPRVGLI